MNKKFATSLLSIVLVFSLILTACGDQKLGAKEALEKAMDASMEMESYSFNGNLTMNITLPEEAYADPEAAMFLPYLENLEFLMDGVYHLENMQTEMTMQIKLGDMSFSVPMVFTEEKMWVKVPNIPIPGVTLPPELTSKYIELDFEELNEMAGGTTPVSPDSVDTQKMQELGLKIFDITASHFDEDEYFTVHDAKDINVPEEIKAAQVVEMNITNENLEPAIVTLVDKVIPEVMDLLAQPEWAEILQIDPSEIEQAKQELAASKDDINEGIAEIKETVNINDFSMIMALDKKNYIPYQELNMDLDITSEGQSGNIGMNFAMTLTDINESPEFKIGIPSEEESIKLEELMEMFMMGY